VFLCSLRVPRSHSGIFRFQYTKRDGPEQTVLASLISLRAAGITGDDEVRNNVAPSHFLHPVTTEAPGIVVFRSEGHPAASLKGLLSGGLKISLYFTPFFLRHFSLYARCYQYQHRVFLGVGKVSQTPHQVRPVVAYGGILLLDDLLQLSKGHFPPEEKEKVEEIPFRSSLSQGDKFHRGNVPIISQAEIRRRSHSLQQS
jgi:hypothetical protein